MSHRTNLNITDQQIMDAFADELSELTKEAGFVGELFTKAFPKVLSWGKNLVTAAKAGGLKEVLNTAAKYKEPSFHGIAGGVDLANKGMRQAAEHVDSNWLTRGVASMADSVRNLGAGMKTTNTLGQNQQQMQSKEEKTLSF